MITAKVYTAQDKPQTKMKRSQVWIILTIDRQ